LILDLQYASSKTRVADFSISASLRINAAAYNRIMESRSNKGSMLDAANEPADTVLREHVAGRSIFDGLTYSDHLFNDALCMIFHVIAAKKILGDPSLIERARSTLERWISKQETVPQPFLEWRQILAGTPQQIAALALSLTEDGTRLRSSSPLGSSLVTPEERAAVYALFGKSIGRKVRGKALGDFLDGWEKEHGPLTEKELEKAGRDLSVEGS
jgi:hypothetical protein